MEQIRLFNTGGTFNKRYDPIAGELVVPRDDRSVVRAAEAFAVNCPFVVEGLIYKDSLEMGEEERELLATAVATAPEERIVVVHGTDTMDKSAAAVAAWLGEESFKRVIFTGAMVPFSIDPVEATANLALALGASAHLAPGVYIAMHGLVLPHAQIRKNRQTGLFERVSG
ncbi:asparaginase domain-containing protein [Hydrogenimonas sp. SS33]|uniref:asparaginase domain-containing protein n=1 Tax=Hydrogenimonas leucolamina TaxID=2954236 RepID=UPI00336C2B21